MSYYENRIKVLEEKVAEMARMQRHKAIPVEAKLVERIAEYQAENTRLKAEVERLRNLGIKLDGYVDLVRHENERLRKAGDAMVELLKDEDYNTEPDEYCMKEVVAWNAAKEGKPSV